MLTARQATLQNNLRSKIVLQVVLILPWVFDWLEKKGGILPLAHINS